MCFGQQTPAPSAPPPLPPAPKAPPPPLAPPPPPAPLQKQAEPTQVRRAQSLRESTGLSAKGTSQLKIGINEGTSTPTGGLNF